MMNFIRVIFMPWMLFECHFWGAVAAAGISFLGAKKSASAADRATQSQQQITEAQIKLAQEQYDRYLEIYGPVEEALGKDVMKGPDYDKAAADTAMAFDVNRGIMERQLGRYGINPSSGRFRGFEEDYSIRRTKGMVDAMNREEDKQWARRLAFTQVGRGLPGAAMAGYSSAAGQFGNIAEMYSKGASSGYGATGYWAGKAIDSYSGSYGLPKSYGNEWQSMMNRADKAFSDL